MGGKSKWVALKTDDLRIAKERARKLLPPEDGEQAWLTHLSRLGSEADTELRRRSALAALTWRNLWDEFMSRAAGTISHTSEESYERWMRILAETADALGLKPDDILKKESCAKVASRLMGAYISAKRMLVFYRRAWRTLGLDAQLWRILPQETMVHTPGGREFYRRLSLEEIRKVHSLLVKRDIELADMVLLGYSTGLRLSDVAEIEISEIEGNGRFLRVVPNKTRISKPLPIKVPLTEQARELIIRRRQAPPDGIHIFSKDARNRPSRRIAAAFRNCGVFRIGNGRASFHSLRATFISLMDEAGVPPHITDTITGHSGGGMHARYTQPSPNALMDGVSRAIPPL